MGFTAFHGKKEVKKFYIDRVHKHYLADEIVKGQYWNNGKGCGVGCTIHSSSHKSYETELGIPEWLARVEDTIFEGLDNNRAKLWPEQFLKAIQPGADLEKVKKPFLIFILRENLKTLKALPATPDFPQTTKAIKLTIAATNKIIKYHQGAGNKEAAYSAYSAYSARSAAYSTDSARSAAYSADSAAYSAYSAYSARSAAYSTDSARSAAYSARSAAYSARSAAYSADSADSAYSAAYSARSAAYSADSAAYSADSADSAYSADSAAFETYADKLLKLLKVCK